MSSIKHRLPEPSLPENELIRAADSLPELSSGLRSSTIKLCQVEYVRGRRIRIAKTSGAVLLATCVVAGIYVTVTQPSQIARQQIVQEPVASPVAPTIPHSPGQSSGRASTIAIGDSGTSTELNSIDGTIEELGNRMLKANLIPGM